MQRIIRQYLAKKKLPDTPGVYFFLGRSKKILYIGRATSLRSRVRSYFTPDIAEKRSSWIAKMLTEAKSLDFRKTDSVLEAILLEADLIKKFQPPYNTDEKDDKSFNCVVITKEDFPAVFIERSKNIDFSSLKIGNCKLIIVYGPFPYGLRLQDALKIVRRIFPYRDLKCRPLQGKPCFNRQIKLCPGVCTGEITTKEYAKTIRNLRLFFEGKKPRLLSLLKTEMKTSAKEQAFEQANSIKKTIFALQHIQDVALLRNSKFETCPSGRRVRNSPQPFRIEGYDLSHFGGKDIVGAMTVVEDGVARPSEYRLFKIRGITNAHETKGLSEMLKRRFGHPEWTHPDLIVVDGNEVQKSTAEKVLAELKLSIPAVAVVKDEKHKPREILGIEEVRFPHLSGSGLRGSAFLANSEAHRFSLAFQKKRRTF
ncbi:MAG: hypothetical protein EXS59_00820 [Candidatus Taylorbacteria bacterium]|nr:hypothetical protein [Candidatus Taylorbacteria bacterium]